jgi:hypothetical protein
MVVGRSEGSVHVVLEFVGNEREREKRTTNCKIHVYKIPPRCEA